MRMGYPRFAVSIVTTVAFVATQVPTAAFAQNSAQAEVLFKEGQQLIAQQKYAEACQRLVASYKLDPQPNTELLQGLCFSKQGKTASAYNAFIDAASTLPKGGDAQKYAADQARTLEAQLLKVRVQFQPTVPAGMQMHFDDEAKPRDKDFVGIDIALDPGEHDLIVTATGKHDYTKHFTLDAASSPKNLIVNMTDKTKEELAAEHPGGGGGPVVVEKPETSWSTVKTIGFIGMIVGGVTLIGGAATQIVALQLNASKQTELNNAPDATSCNYTGDVDPASQAGGTMSQQCHAAWNFYHQATTAQALAIGLAVGGAAIGIAGIVMFVAGGNVTKSPEKPAAASFQLIPWIGPQGAGLGAIGTF